MAETKDFLLEIGCEEMPSAPLNHAVVQLGELVRKGLDEAGLTYAINDPMASTLQTLAQRHASDTQATVQALGTLPAIWGEALPRHTAWLDAVSQALASIDRLGIIPAVDELNCQPEQPA